MKEYISTSGPIKKGADGTPNACGISEKNIAKEVLRRPAENNSPKTARILERICSVVRKKPLIMDEAVVVTNKAYQETVST